MSSAQKPEIKGFFHSGTNTVSYLLWDPDTMKGAIIDPVLDFDHKSGKAETSSADALLQVASDNGVTLEWVLETHVHADHLTAAPYLREKLGGNVGIGDKIPVIQKTFGDVFNAEEAFARDGSQFDKLFADGEAFSIGAIEGKVIHTPGHTPACVTFLIGDAAFVGDTLFMPDYGTARCDFPGGDARTLYKSIQKIFTLPDETRLFMCHDYKAPERDAFAWKTTVADEKANNIHIGGGVSEDDFVKMRDGRDATLSMPRLILPSVQVNMRAGEMPPKEDNGVSYLKLPIDAL